MTAAAQIQQIDIQIDAVRGQLYRRIGYMPATAADFQAAWDRNPILLAKHRALFLARGNAQVERDADDERAYRAEQRRVRASYRKAA